MESGIVAEFLFKEGEENIAFELLHNKSFYWAMEKFTIQEICLKSQKVVFFLQAHWGWHEGIYYKLVTFVEVTIGRNWKDIRFSKYNAYMALNSEEKPLKQILEENTKKKQFELVLGVA